MKEACHLRLTLFDTCLNNSREDPQEFAYLSALITFLWNPHELASMSSDLILVTSFYLACCFIYASHIFFYFSFMQKIRNCSLAVLLLEQLMENLIMDIWLPWTWVLINSKACYITFPSVHLKLLTLSMCMPAWAERDLSWLYEILLDPSRTEVGIICYLLSIIRGWSLCTMEKREPLARKLVIRGTISQRLKSR